MYWLGQVQALELQGFCCVGSFCLRGFLDWPWPAAMLPRGKCTSVLGDEGAVLLTI